MFCSVLFIFLLKINVLFLLLKVWMFSCSCWNYLLSLGNLDEMCKKYPAKACEQDIGEGDWFQLDNSTCVKVFNQKPLAFLDAQVSDQSQSSSTTTAAMTTSDFFWACRFQVACTRFPGVGQDHGHLVSIHNPDQLNGVICSMFRLNQQQVLYWIGLRLSSVIKTCVILSFFPLNDSRVFFVWTHPLPVCARVTQIIYLHSNVKSDGDTPETMADTGSDLLVQEVTYSKQEGCDHVEPGSDLWEQEDIWWKADDLR